MRSPTPRCPTSIAASAVIVASAASPESSPEEASRIARPSGTSQSSPHSNPARSWRTEIKATSAPMAETAKGELGEELEVMQPVAGVGKRSLALLR